MGKEKNGGCSRKNSALWSVRREVEARVLIHEEVRPGHIARERVTGDGTLRHRTKGPYDRVDGGRGNGGGKALDENADGREIEYNVSTKSNIHCLGIRGIEGSKLSAQEQIGIRECWANSLY